MNVVHVILYIVSLYHIVELVISPEDVSVNAGDTILVTCVGQGDNPTITWSKSGQMLNNETDSSGRVAVYSEMFTESGVLFVQSVLQVCSVEDADSGGYTCTVSGYSTSVSADFNVTINTVPASLVIVPDDSYPIVGSTIILTCVASGYPLPDISWSKESVEVMNSTDTLIYNGVVMEGGERYSQSTLFLCPSEVVGSFLITCSASNGLPGGSVTSRSTNITTEGWMDMFCTLMC